jgi:small-conductance mechanosensitive channel
MLAALLAAALLGPARRACAGEDQRIVEARAAVEAARVGLRGASNEMERAAWQSRADTAASMLSNAEKLAAFEAKELTAISERQITSDYALQKVLTAIETATTEFEQTIKTEDSAVRRLKVRRRQQESAIKKEAGSEAAAALASDGELRTLDAEIGAHLLRRDTAELRVRLAREAGKIEQERRRIDLGERVTLRGLIEKKGQGRLARKQLNELQNIRDGVTRQKEETARAIASAKESLSCFDERVNILNERYKVMRDTSYLDVRDQAESPRKRSWLSSGTDNEVLKNLKQVVGEEESRKRLMQDRITFLEQQVATMDDYLGAIEQGCALLEAQAANANDAYDQVKVRYLKYVSVPVSMLLAMLIVYLFISRAVLPVLCNKDSLFVARRMGGYLFILLAIVMLVSFFLEDLRAIATVMGIVGAAIVIALQDLCSSFAGWFVIVTGRKIRVGDRVEIDGCRGDVVDIQILRTTLLELNNWLGVNEQTGRHLFIPNSFIFKSNIFNYSHIHPYVWGKCDIEVTFETPPQKAYDTLFRVLSEECRDEFDAAKHAEQLMEKRYGAVRSTFEPAIHTVIAASGVCFTLFYAAHYRRALAVKDRLMKRVLEEFEKDPTLQLAYPTERHIPTPPPQTAVARPV